MYGFLNVSKHLTMYDTMTCYIISKRFGVTGILLSWFSSYLENRIQRVVLDGKAF